MLEVEPVCSEPLGNASKQPVPHNQRCNAMCKIVFLICIEQALPQLVPRLYAYFIIIPIAGTENKVGAWIGLGLYEPGTGDVSYVNEIGI